MPEVHQRHPGVTGQPVFLGPKTLRFSNAQFIGVKADGTANAQNVQIVLPDDKGDLIDALTITPNTKFNWPSPNQPASCFTGRDFLVKIAEAGDGVRVIWSMILISFMLLFGTGAKAQPFCEPSDFWCAILQNSDLSGIASTSLTNVFIASNAGNGTNTVFWGHIFFPNGSAANPAITFFSDPNTGIYSVTDDVLGIGTAGSLKWSINAAGDLTSANGLTLVGDNSITGVDAISANAIGAAEANISTINVSSVNIGNLTISPISMFRKASPQTSTDTVLADDSALQFAVTPGETYFFEMEAFVTGATADGIKVSINGPASTVPIWHAKIYKSNALTAAATETVFNTTTSIAATDAETVVHISGTIGIGATPGTVAFRWAKNTDTTTDTTVVAGSWIRWARQ